ncbi:MAG: N-acetyl sugar amidotransferase [Clostridia bacterium]|nr:N-acetyl sugar amidotransferase [Clostridia bacterium]
MNELKRCSKCTIPETHETITFDNVGVCNICSQHQYKKENIDWEARHKEFIEIIEEYRGKNDYDCLVPFSGGKDSTFTLYELVEKYKLKPLVISFDHGFYRPQVEENKLKTFRKLGVDVLKYTPNWKVVKKLLLESLKRKGDFCWHCHTGIFAYPMHIAVKFKVPLVIWGEPSAEYTSYYSYDDGIEEVDEERFNRFVNLGITAEDMVGMLDGTVTMRDLTPFTYPKLKDLKSINYRSFCLGSYIPWDVKKQSDLIKKELGWQEEEVEGVLPGYGYEKIECQMQGVRDYLKYIKRGYSRVSHLTSIDIRNGRMSREEAMKYIKEYEGKRPASLDVFLDYVGISEEEFNEIAVSLMVHPNRVNPEKLGKGNQVWDQRLWYRENTKGLSLKELVKDYDYIKSENEILKAELDRLKGNK